MNDIEKKAEDLYQDISAILDPIESRMYAIQINYAEWLRDNNLHLVRVGPGHEAFRAIEKLVEKTRLAERRELLEWITRWADCYDRDFLSTKETDLLDGLLRDLKQKLEEK